MAYPRSREGSILNAAWDLLDVGAAFLLVVATDVVVLAGAGSPAVRVPLVVLAVFLAPGYVWIAALRPAQSNRRVDGPADEQLGLGERFLLAAGASIGIVTMVGFALHYTGLGIGAVTTLEALTVVVLAGSVVTAVRRLQVDRSARFGPEEFLRPLVAARGLVSSRTRLDLAISLVLVGSLVVGAAGVVSVAASVGDGDSFTEFYLTNENETGAEVAAGARTAGDSVVLGIDSHEGQSTTYTVVVQRERVTDGTVTAREDGERFQVEVPAGGTWETEYAVPDGATTGDGDTRLTFLLYRDGPPDDPGRETAYRSVHTWLASAADGE